MTSLWKSEDVSRALAHLQESYGWRVSFIGCGDTAEVKRYAAGLGVKAENVVAYTTADQLESAFAAV